MSLDVHLIDPNAVIYEANITHNLTTMADKANIYKALWRPEEIGAIRAEDIIQQVEQGYIALRYNPEYFKTFNSSNGWGTYKNFLPWVKNYLDALKENPEALLLVDR